jgi:cytochrome b
MRVLRTLIAVIARWFIGASVLRYGVAATAGGSEHGSVGYIVLAWCLAFVGAFTHVLILFLRARRRR